MTNRDRLGTVASVATVACQESVPGGQYCSTHAVAYEGVNPLIDLVKHGYTVGHRSARASSKLINERTVARIATVAIANPKMPETAVPYSPGRQPACLRGQDLDSSPLIRASRQLEPATHELTAWITRGIHTLYKDKKEVYSRESLVYPVKSYEFQSKASIPSAPIENLGAGEFATAIPAIFATVQKNGFQSRADSLASALEPVDLSGSRADEGDMPVSTCNAELPAIGLATLATVATVDAHTGTKTSPIPIQGLPWRLRDIATRVCQERYWDDAEGVAAMLDDLTQVDPALWEWLIDYFDRLHLETQANRRPSMVVRCQDCAHAAFKEHAVIAHCAADVRSGLAIVGFWATDLHVCERFCPGHA